MIRRKTTQFDIEHGGTFSKEFVDKGVTYYQKNDGTNHSDKLVNNESFTYDDEEELLTSPNAHITHNLEVDTDAVIHNELTVDNDGHFGNDVDIVNDLSVGNDGHIEGSLQVDTNATIDGDTEVGGNTTLSGTLDVAGATHICDTTTIDADTNVNGTLTVAGDLHVKGTAYEEHSTDIYVGSDFVTLRDGAETGLDDGERAGIIVNNYDGTDSLGLVMSNDGMLRLGNFNTVKVYTTDDETYYSDRELTDEIELPEDVKLFQVGETDPETGLKEYYYISKDETEAIATRRDSDDMVDHQLVCWNAEGNDFETIGDLPNGNAAILQYNVDEAKYEYLEQEGPGKVIEYDDVNDKLRWSEGATTCGQLLSYNPSTCSLEWVPKATGCGQILRYYCEQGDPEYKYVNGIEVTELKSRIESGAEYYVGMGGGEYAPITSIVEDDPDNSHYKVYIGDGTEVWSGNAGSDVFVYVLEPTAPIEKLEWVCRPGVYTFNTMSEYLAVCDTIPTCSRVAIINCCDYTVSDVCGEEFD